MRLPGIEFSRLRGVAILLTFGVSASCGPAMAAEMPPLSDGSENQLGLTFSPDGTTAFWVGWNGEWGADQGDRKVIYRAELENGLWTQPRPALPEHPYSDDDPFVSIDGEWLYFVSNRPVDDADESLDTNIWRYHLASGRKPELVPVSSSAEEYSPVMTASGALYFASSRGSGPGQGDLYRALPIDGGFGPAEALGPAVNSPTGEWNLWVSADESELLFEASSRPTNLSVPGDLYYSWRTTAGWTAALPMAGLNTGGSDLMPRLHPDGETLYFTSAMAGGHARIVSTDWEKQKADMRADYAPLLLVANRSSHEVTFVDLAEGQVVARIETGEGPHLLSNVANGRVLVTGYGEFPEPHKDPVGARPPFVESLNSRMTLVDVDKQKVLLDQRIDGCAKPHASWIVGQSAFVTCETVKKIVVIDLDTGRTSGHLDSGQDGSHVLGFDPASNTLAVSNTESGSVTLIDIESGDRRIVKLGSGSEGSFVLDSRVWVANAMDGSVSIVDARTGSVDAHLDSLCDFPIALSKGREDRVWLACFASSELVAINGEKLTVERHIRLEGQPLHVLLHPERELAYVSLPRMNAVAEIDLASGEELRRISVGIEPDGLRWAQ